MRYFNILKDRQTLSNGLFFQDNLVAATGKVKRFWILMKQEVVGWQSH